MDFLDDIIAALVDTECFPLVNISCFIYASFVEAGEGSDVPLLLLPRACAAASSGQAERRTSRRSV